ncbi:MAG: hypothetical protein PHX30_02850 [Candidatus Pacebacteria bacterium]|nr:hypothetical protein [Candidatus Paceibacterota bacterium]
MEKDFSKEILEKIKKEQIKPRSKRYFMLKNSVVWFVFAMSIILGALSFSVILHFWEINDWDAYYRVNDNFLAFIFLTMPYFWLMCFLLFVGVAYLYLKHTREGYRLEFAKVVIWNLVLSFVFGSALYSVGVGRQVENELVKRAPLYNDFRKNQQNVWLRPEQGVIIGKVIEIAENGDFLELNDPRQVVWTVNVSDTEYFQGFVIQKGFSIKVFGEEGGNHYFIAREIRPLMKEHGPRRMLVVEE